MRKALPWVVCGLLVGCHAVPEAKPPRASKGFREAVAMMCDVDRLASISADAEPIGTGVKRSAWLSEHVSDPDAIELRTLMSVKDAATQARMLRDAAHGAGIGGCVLADSMERSGMGGLAP